MDHPDGAKRFPVDGELGQHEPEALPEYAEIVAFFGHIAYVMPPLREVLAEHLRVAEGEMLPILLMEDVTAWLLNTFRTTGPDGRTLQLLSILDAGYHEASDQLRSVILLGFLERIPGFAGQTTDADGAGMLVRSGLGPTLSAVLAEVESWRDDSIGT